MVVLVRERYSEYAEYGDMIVEDCVVCGILGYSR